MKKIFTLIAASLFMFSAFAQPNEAFRKTYGQGKISVSTLASDQVKVVIDGANYNNQGNDEMLVKDIKAGYHSVKVYQLKKGKYIKDSKFGKNLQLIYDGNVYVKPQYHVDITINRFGKAFIDEQAMGAGYYESDDNNGNGGWDNGVQAMNDRAFDQFKQIIRKENFDNTRLAVAKQTISSNNISSAQVKELMQLFSFENSKLDLAKYSFKYTVDKNNYFMLNDAFAFSSSKEELARFIQAYK